jgi:hypothetical protein
MASFLCTHHRSDCRICRRFPRRTRNG